MGVSTHEMPPPPNVKCITRDAIFRCSLHRVAWDTLPVLIIRDYWLRLSPVTELLFSNSWFNKHGQAVVTSAMCVPRISRALESYSTANSLPD